ncbi:putative reverse transcriptase domain-containing protein [Tanacetum coccineum]
MAPKRTTRSTPVTPTPNATTTTTVTEAQLQALIDQGVAAAMAEAEASRVRNGYNGHLAKDCRSRPANANNNNRNNNNNNQKGNGCYECGAQGHFKRNCPKLKNNDRGNQAGNDRAPAKVYVVGNAGENPNNIIAELGSFDAIIGMDWLAKYQAIIVCAEKIVRIPWGNETLIIHGDGKLLKKEELYAKFSKCEFWILKVQFLGHVIDSEGIHVDPDKIESVKDRASPKSPTEIR